MTRSRHASPPAPPPLVEHLRADPLLAVEWRQDDVRDTDFHAHAPGQLIGSLSGLLSVTTASETSVVPVTHAIWIPPGRTHAMRSHGPFAGWSIYIAEAACARLPAEPQVLLVSGLLREAAHRAVSWGGPPSSVVEHRLADVILDEISSLSVEPLSLPRPRDPRVQRITDALLADPADDRPLSAWADWAGITPRTLGRRFVAQTGFGFSEWRQRARALRAIELLAAGSPVTMVAMDLGYENVSAFIAMFRRTLGVTPGRYVRLRSRPPIQA